MPMQVEVCVDSWESACIVGPSLLSHSFRMEVCSNLISGGGLTPHMGLVKLIADTMRHSRLMIMLRPRPGSFVYTKTEIEQIEMDIWAFKFMNLPQIKGFVFGALTPKGRVDVKTCRIICEAAAGYEVTFHRAFDLVEDWKAGFAAIASIPAITRILTSGRAAKVTSPEAIVAVKELMTWAKDLSENPFSMIPPRKIIIVPASGINASNLDDLRQSLPSMVEFHLSSSSARIDDRGSEPGKISSTIKRGEELGFGQGKIWKMDAKNCQDVLDMVLIWNMSPSIADWPEGDSALEREVLDSAKADDEEKERLGVWSAKSLVKGKQNTESSDFDKLLNGSQMKSRDSSLSSLSKSSSRIGSPGDGIGEEDVEELLRKDAVIRKERREKSENAVASGSGTTNIDLIGEGSKKPDGLDEKGTKDDKKEKQGKGEQVEKDRAAQIDNSPLRIGKRIRQ